MSASAYRDFWTVPVADVPMKTGAAPVMDCSDIRAVLNGLGLSLAQKSVLDVGCGTGRLAQLCGSWTGVDISPSMVAYCADQELQAYVIASPVDLVSLYGMPWRGAPVFDAIVCLSVFTHIAREDRQAYLTVFASLADELLVDILPGEDGGYPGVWFADPATFEDDLATAGYTFTAFSRTSLDSADHRYYLCRR